MKLDESQKKDVLAMTKTPGWKILAKAMERQIEFFRNLLELLPEDLRRDDRQFRLEQQKYSGEINVLRRILKAPVKYLEQTEKVESKTPKDEEGI